MSKDYQYTKINIDEIKPYEKNARIHSSKQIKQIMEAIKAFGFTNPLLIDDENNLIAGHGRLEAVKQLNIIDFKENPLKELPAIIITGLSGAGKSTLAKEIAKQYNIKVIEKNEWNDDSIINNFKGNIDEVLDFLTKVGLNTQPSYLKPYSVLSNGEKMRCDVAKAIFENDFVIIDEFTSVVDRHIAKIICMCIKKLLNKYTNKKIIFVSCHKDFLEWLEPDWHYDLDTQTFLKDLLWQRPKMEFYITKGQRADWELFRQYHYLNHNLASITNIFLLLNENKDKVGFIAFKAFPHPTILLEKIHRLVILPDYQGVGLGNSFLSKTCALHFKEKKKVISITTSLIRFANSIKKNKDFICFHCGSGRKNKGKSELNKAQRFRKISFKYIPSIKAK